MQTVSTDTGRPHREWQSRPDDQRYLSLEDAWRDADDRRGRSVTPVLDYRALALGYDQDGNLFLTQGPTGVRPDGSVRTNEGTWDLGRTAFTHYSFGQFAGLVAPESGGSGTAYLRNHPAPLTRMMLQFDASQRTGTTMLLATPEQMSRRADGLGDVRAFTSASYGRVWNSEILEQLIDITGGKWKVPAASYASRDPKLASTIYDSDRSMFTFLVRDDMPIDGGDGSPLFPMFGVGNSEVGDEAITAFSGLYRYVCDNRQLHGTGQLNAV